MYIGEVSELFTAFPCRIIELMLSNKWKVIYILIPSCVTRHRTIQLYGPEHDLNNSEAYFGARIFTKL